MDKARRPGFDIAHEIGQRQVRFQSNKHVHVIGHVVNGDEFLLLTRDDTGDVFLEFLIVLRLNETLSPFNRKHDVDVNLSVRVGHPSKMPLLTELGILLQHFYDDVVSAGLAP